MEQTVQVPYQPLGLVNKLELSITAAEAMYHHRSTADGSQPHFYIVFLVLKATPTQISISLI